MKASLILFFGVLQLRIMRLFVGHAILGGA